MTQKLFDLNSYVKEFSAVVTACREDEKKPGEYLVELDKTAFFPEGGGQPADTGTLGGVLVVYVSEKQGVILHHCTAPLAVGEPVEGKINWQRRFSHMQTHCGEHILSGIIKKEFNLENVGFHMGKEFTTIDLDGPMTEEMVEQVEELANQAICENVPVKVYYPTREELEQIPLRKKPEVENLRVVEVTGYDWCGCCGTHVALTGEVGLIKIVDFQRYKGGTRLFFHCGARALEDYRQKHKAIKRLAEGFSCKPEGVEESVHKLEEELSQTKGRIGEKNRLLFDLLGSQLKAHAPSVGGGKWLFLWDSGFTAEEAKAFAMAAAKGEGVLCTFFTPVAGGVRYAAAKSRDLSDISLKALCAALNKATGGKGGGSEELFCGNIPQAVEEKLKTLLQGLAESQNKNAAV